MTKIEKIVTRYSELVGKGEDPERAYCIAVAEWAQEELANRDK